MSPRPHPILKRDSSPFRTPVLPFSQSGPFSPHVHFPPTPRMVSTHPAYSPQTYDRAPIVIFPNACQLPRRGARTLVSPGPSSGDERRGRTRSRSRNRGGRSPCDEPVKGSYFHPRAYEACKPEMVGDGYAAAAAFELPSPPALVPDLSPSDESDEVLTPPDPNQSPPLPPSLHFVKLPLDGPADKHPLGSPPLRARHAPPPKGTLPRRPNLVRRSGSDKRISAFAASALDEGCLGGF